MLTSLRIDDDLYRVAKASAASEGVTITKFLDQALRLRLVYDANNIPQKTANLATPISLPTCSVPLKLGNLSMEDLDTAEDLYDKEEAERFFKLSEALTPFTSPSASPHA
jgi:hypothetical protein